MGPLDANIANSRFGGPSFSVKQRLERLVFTLIWSVGARFTPPNLFRWRNVILKIFGAQISDTARVYGSAAIWYPRNLVVGDHATIGPRTTIYCMGTITIREHAIISQGAHICAGSHLIDDPSFQLISKPIVIGRNAWIAADAFVGPGVKVGDGAVLGARGCAMRDLEACMVYTGNPAVALRRRNMGA